MFGQNSDKYWMILFICKLYLRVGDMHHVFLVCFPYMIFICKFIFTKIELKDKDLYLIHLSCIKIPSFLYSSDQFTRLYASIFHIRGVLYITNAFEYSILHFCNLFSHLSVNLIYDISYEVFSGERAKK